MRDCPLAAEAGEKNRVAFLRDRCQAAAMPAAVYCRDSVEPTRLALYERRAKSPGAAPAYVVVLDGAQASVVSAQAAAVYRAYGVMAAEWDDAALCPWKAIRRVGVIAIGAARASATGRRRWTALLARGCAAVRREIAR